MPFAGYRDFADCVRQNQDKDDPNAYCAFIERQAKEEDDRYKEGYRRLRDS
jgi:hypothetical protein